MFHKLLENASVLIFVGFIYSMLLYRYNLKSRYSEAIMGILFGIGAIISMLITLQWQNGIIFDGRSIILSIAAFTGGPVTAAIAVVMSIIFRIYMGGLGMITGISVILASAGIGLIYHFIGVKKNVKWPFLNAYSMGVVVQMVMILLLFTLPVQNIQKFISQLVIPVLILFPLATGIIGWFFHDQKIKYEWISLIRENESLFGELIDHSPVGFFIYDAESGKIEKPNEAFHRITKIEKGSVSLISLSRNLIFTSPDVTIRKIFENNESQHSLLIRDDGQPDKSCILSTFQIDQKIFLCYLEDITNVIESERKQKEKEDLVNLAFMGTMDGIWIWDIDKKIIFDEHWDNLLGYETGEISYTPEWFLSNIHPDDQNKLETALENYISGKCDFYDVEYRIRSKYGEWRWIWGIGKASKFNEAGKPVQLSGTHRDITERKNLQERIRKNEEHLSLAQESARIGTWEWDLRNDQIYLSKVTQQLTGIREDVLPGKFDLFLENVVPEEKEWILGIFDNAKISLGDIDIEYKIHQQGKYRWILNKCRVIGDKEGPARIIGTIQDISAKKKAELKLKNSFRTLNALFNNSIDGITYTDLNGRFVYGNRAFYQLTGYTSKELSGKSWKYITPEKWHHLEADLFLKKQMKKGHSGLIEKEYIHKNGSILPVQISSSLDYDEQEKHLGIWNIVRDMRAIKKANSDLDRSEEKFRTIVKSSPIATILIDHNGKAIYVNQAFCKMTGRQENELLKDWSRSIVPDDRKRVITEFRSSMKKNLPYEGSGRYIRKDGEIIWWESRFVPINVKDESTVYVGMVLDITKQLQAERNLENQSDALRKHVEDRTRELEEKTSSLEKTQKALTYLLEDVNDTRNDLEISNQRMEAAIQELEAFSYSVSHDLRAPLRSIDGFSNALLEDYIDDLDETGMDFLKRIRTSTERMGQLIEDMLQLSRISRVELSIEEVNISVLCDEIIETLRSQEPGRNIKYKSTPNLTIRSDRRLLRIMLENLIGNAWKFTRNKKTAIIMIGKEVNSNHEEGTVFFIKDNGTGFDIKYESEIYIPFKRLHEEDKFEGTGIGLATVQRIANRLAIGINAKSKKGKGSTFFLKFHDKS
jgi:PAS domain S-box-containing protein